MVLVSAQCAVAVVSADQRWFVWFATAYLVGATIDHALWVLIHECSHNLVFRARWANRVLAIVANIPMVVPGAISFIKYHLLHHRHLGEIEMDAGVPSPGEAELIGRSAARKTMWLSAYALVQSVRPKRLTSVPMLDRWTVLNTVVECVAIVGLVRFAGLAPLKYLVTSTVFAIGLHPLGGRWIQEHFAIAEGQETYSYYGILNKVAFNAGYHVEHHDLITVPWSRLPEIRRTAPEFYDGLQSYRSWTALIARFVFDRQLTLFNYIVRPRREASASDPPASAA